jgi:amphiphysin
LQLSHFRQESTANTAIAQLIDASKHWRDSWADILNRQSAILSDYEVIYCPIVGSDGSEAEKYAATPRLQLERVNMLKSHYFDLKTDMLEEVALVDKRIIEPAKDARLSLKTYKKVIKKRQDKKLDYERYKGRVDSVEKKTKRTDRENTALAKHHIDLSTATTVSLPCYSYHTTNTHTNAFAGIQRGRR